MTRLRARELGIPFDGTPGAHNAITDVQGVEVGHTTLVAGENVRTGVTAILPAGASGSRDSAFAAGYFGLNGNGEMTGTAWLTESGSLTTPIVTTNTHSIGAAHAGTIEWLCRNNSSARARWYMPVIGETYDGDLNDIDGQHVRSEHVVAALDAATGGPVAEGNVGGGTGMVTYDFKGGIGTSSRLATLRDGSAYTVGVLVQSNFGARRELTIRGVSFGDLPIANTRTNDFVIHSGSGSIIATVATDAPLLPHQCTALAKRVSLGLARTGTTGSHFSGDLFLAFSTAQPGALTSTTPARTDTAATVRQLAFVAPGDINPLYEAVVQATEEAVINALCAGERMRGRDGTVCEALPVDVVQARLAAR